MRISADFQIDGPASSVIRVTNAEDGGLVINCEDSSSLRQLVRGYKQSRIRKYIGTFSFSNPLSQRLSILVGSKQYLNCKAGGKPGLSSWRMIWLYLWA